MDYFVAYYRVSTDRQGQSGLGLDAQRAAVAGFVAGRGGLAAECVEVESGRRTDRPELIRALDLCRQRRAVLVIAKLDRLAHNVHFISGLMESGVPFVACDMPNATPFMLHIHAAVAEAGLRDVVAAELWLREPTDPGRLNGCGLLVVNPPWGFEAAAGAVLSALLERLGAGEPGQGWAVTRVAEE